VAQRWNLCIYPNSSGVGLGAPAQNKQKEVNSTELSMYNVSFFFFFSQARQRDKAERGEYLKHRQAATKIKCSAKASTSTAFQLRRMEAVERSNLQSEENKNVRPKKSFCFQKSIPWLSLSLSPITLSALICMDFQTTVTGLLHYSNTE